MPRTALPTPASSTDITGADGAKHLAAAGLQMAFELPPPAVGGLSPPPTSFDPKTTSPVLEPFRQSSASSKPTAASPTFFPVQAAETVKSRRRTSSAAQAQAPGKDAFALPPPPTRSRKIIQMKPRGAAAAAEEQPTASTSGSGAGSSKGGKANAASTATAAAAESNTSNASAVPPPAAAGAKRKQPSATSAAGRKIARKTAHSLIERRRRSKMNEEFALLKSMIPACTGEMHKLAILQASIEYVRYLEDCVSRLKSQRSHDPHNPITPTEPAPYNPERQYVFEPGHSHYGGADSEDEDKDEEEEDPDVEMAGSELPSPAFTAANRSSHPSVSPTLLAEDARAASSTSSSSSISHPNLSRRHPQSAATTLPDPRRHGSYSSAASDNRHYSFSHSDTTSPAFGPQQYPTPLFGGGSHSAAGSALTSPALGPQRDVDHEATAALLMLNSDRRGSKTEGSDGRRRGDGRGMSVRDLLSA